VPALTAPQQATGVRREVPVLEDAEHELIDRRTIRDPACPALTDAEESYTRMALLHGP
jgi:hypothetical protein